MRFVTAQATDSTARTVAVRRRNRITRTVVMRLRWESDKMNFLKTGFPIYAVPDVCACGSQCVGCPECGEIRCLHCDPLEVNPEREPDCHAD